MKYAPFLVILVLVGALAVSCDGNRGWGRWEASRDSVLAHVRQREDSAQRLMAQSELLATRAESLATIAARKALRGETAYRSAMNLLDSLQTVQIPDTCLPLASGWRRTVDSLLVAYDSTQAALEATRGAYVALSASYGAMRAQRDLYRESVDSLVALVGRVPKGCRILGVPCPTINAGVGAVLSDGKVAYGPGATFGWSLPIGRRRE